MASEYRTTDGIPVTLDRLCRLEPEWAANRIRLLTEQLDATIAELARVRADRLSDAERAALATLRDMRRDSITGPFMRAQAREQIEDHRYDSWGETMRALRALLAPEGEVSR